jgi:hypothetical protein
LFEEKKDSYTSSSLTKNQELYYLSNYYKIEKANLWNRCRDMAFPYYLKLEKGSRFDRDKEKDRKSFHPGPALLVQAREI